MEKLTFDSSISRLDDSCYLPLPFYAWDARPLGLPLDEDECRTALHLEHGSLTRSARLLKVTEVRLMRAIRRSAGLTALYNDLLDVIPYKSADVVIDTLYDPASDRRQLEWAAAKGLSSRAAARQAHPLSPAGEAPAVTVNTGDVREIIFTWKSPERTIDNEPEPVPCE